MLAPPGPDDQRDPGEALPPGRGRRYLWGLAAGAAGALVGYLALLGGLHATGNLPPPAIANSDCIDEKLAFLRERAPEDPNLLVVGSSIAWRHFDGAMAPEGVRPLNAGFCGVNVRQAAGIAHWLAGRFAGIEDAIFITGPQDFQGCPPGQPAFDLGDADRLVFGGASPWPFYVRNFDPVSLLRNATRIARQRTNRYPWNPLVFTRWGDGPWATTIDLGLRYGNVSRLDERCFAAMRQLALDMAGAGRRFMVATSPLHPHWKETYDPAGRIAREFDRRLEAALAGTGAAYWNGDRQHPLEPAAFVDAIHLHWSAVHDYAADVLQAFAARAGPRVDDSIPGPQASHEGSPQWLAAAGRGPRKRAMDPEGSVAPTGSARGLFGRLDPRRLLALGPLYDLELDFLPFFQGLEAVHLDRREMGEKILAAFVGRDEAEAFSIVEPLDGTGCHNRAIRL